MDLQTAPPPLRRELRKIIDRVARDHGIEPEAVMSGAPKVGRVAVYNAKGDAMALASNLTHGDRPMASVCDLASVFGISRAVFIKLRKRSPHFRPRYHRR